MYRKNDLKTEQKKNMLFGKDKQEKSVDFSIPKDTNCYLVSTPRKILGKRIKFNEGTISINK